LQKNVLSRVEGAAGQGAEAEIGSEEES
jgi:hypothetical protein